MTSSTPSKKAGIEPEQRPADHCHAHGDQRHARIFNYREGTFSPREGEQKDFLRWLEKKLGNLEFRGCGKLLLFDRAKITADQAAVILGAFPDTLEDLQSAECVTINDENRALGYFFLISADESINSEVEEANKLHIERHAGGMSPIPEYTQRQVPKDVASSSDKHTGRAPEIPKIAKSHREKNPIDAVLSTAKSSPADCPPEILRLKDAFACLHLHPPSDKKAFVQAVKIILERTGYAIKIYPEESMARRMYLDRNGVLGFQCTNKTTPGFCRRTPSGDLEPRRIEFIPYTRPYQRK